MTKINKTFFLLLFSLYSCSGSCLAAPHVEIAPNKSFVKIISTITVDKCIKKKKTDCFKGNFQSTGSGVAVAIHRDFDLIVTAGHVCATKIKNIIFRKDIVSYSSKIQVLDFTGTIHNAEIIFYFEGNIEKSESDLCLLYVPNLGIPKVKLSSVAPRVGDKVTSMSAPGGVYHPPVVPIFRGVYSGRINNIAAIATVPSRPGSSGGPVLNERGQLIGIIFAVSVYSENITLISNWEKTKDFINLSKKLFPE